LGFTLGGVAGGPLFGAAGPDAGEAGMSQRSLCQRNMASTSQIFVPI
jgi:hypothetical protein